MNITNIKNLFLSTQATHSNNSKADILVYAQTNTGIVRGNNEDNFFVSQSSSEFTPCLPDILPLDLDKKNSCFLVSDGMGGGAAGEVASLLVIKKVLKDLNLEKIQTQKELTDLLIHCLKSANDQITEKARENPSFSGMGATATLAVVFKDKLFVAQVGDSRAYLIRSNTISQITKDQSFVQQLIENNLINKDEACSHPKRNIILQALSSQQKTLKVAITAVPVYHNDTLILCSDGLTEYLKEEEIKKVISGSVDIKSACNQLIKIANDRGGKDNITVIIAHFVSESFPQSINSNPIAIEKISEFF